MLKEEVKLISSLSLPPLPPPLSLKVTEDDISEENFLAIYKPTKITVTGNIVSNDLELLNLLKVQMLI